MVLSFVDAFVLYCRVTSSRTRVRFDESSAIFQPISTISSMNQLAAEVRLSVSRVAEKRFFSWKTGLYRPLKPARFSHNTENRRKLGVGVDAPANVPQRQNMTLPENKHDKTSMSLVQSFFSLFFPYFFLDLISLFFVGSNRRLLTPPNCHIYSLM